MEGIAFFIWIGTKPEVKGQGAASLRNFELLQLRIKIPMTKNTFALTGMKKLNLTQNTAIARHLTPATTMDSIYNFHFTTSHQHYKDHTKLEVAANTPPRQISLIHLPHLVRVTSISVSDSFN